MFIRKLATALPTYIFLVLLNCSCTKIDTTTLGANLIPAVDNIHTFDTTFNIVATNFDTPVCDSVYRTDLHVVGIIPNDPLFGKTTAGIYVEFKPQYYPFNFPSSDNDSLLLDSAVMVLHYSHSYGDTTLPQKVQVYKLLNKFTPDTTYTTCNVFAFDQSDLLGETSFVPARLTDSVHVLREDASNQLRIKLSNSFAQKFITDSSIIFHTDTTFTDYFKGFAIIADQMFGGNALNYFDLNSADSRLSFYLRSSVGTTKDTSIIDFPFTAYSGEANSIIRERGNSEISHISSNPAGDSIIYIQTAPGTYAELKIPGLNNLSNRIINRAELIVDEVYTPPTYLTTPNFLYLDTKDTSTNGTYIPIPCDFTTTNLQPDFSYFGGARKIINDPNGNPISQYVFNISRYVQSIVTKGSNNATLRLRAPYNIINNYSYVDRCNQLISPFNFPVNNIAEGGVKLNGTNNTATRMRLHIIYSTL